MNVYLDRTLVYTLSIQWNSDLIPLSPSYLYRDDAFMSVRMAERSKALRSGRSLLM